KEMLKKYDGQRRGFCFPVVSNQKMNAYLKEIADLAGISQNLTFHMSRHTNFYFLLKTNKLQENFLDR
ncbi:MAG: site-specific integrase, partial [Dysgonamonadaceae bacterium]|nr:site-specific integrase [Dysgonamonadaceae bacterium]